MQESIELLRLWLETDKFNHFKAKRLNKLKNKKGVTNDLAEYLEAVKLLNFKASKEYVEMFLKLKKLNQLLCYFEVNSDCILYTVYEPEGLEYHNFTTLATEEALKLLSDRD